MFPKPNGSAIGNQFISPTQNWDKGHQISINFILGHGKNKFILGFIKAIIRVNCVYKNY